MRAISNYLVCAGVTIVLSSCESLNQPLAEGRVSPLDVAGGVVSPSRAKDETGFTSLGSIYTPGEFLSTTALQTPFFKDIPEGDASADKILELDTKVKFVADEEEYFKVETVEGDVGYVPALMVGLPMEDPDPLPGIIDLPDLPPEEDPGGLPPLPEPEKLKETSTGESSAPSEKTGANIPPSPTPAPKEAPEAPEALPEP